MFRACARLRPHHFGTSAHRQAALPLDRPRGESATAVAFRGLSTLLAAAAVFVLGGCQAAPVATAGTAAASPAASQLAGLDAAARARPVAFLDRLGWGADAAQLRELRSVGATRWLDSQLQAPATPALPEGLGPLLAGLPVNAPLQQWVPSMVVEQRRARMRSRALAASDPAAAQAPLRMARERQNLLARQAMEQQVLLDVYAPNQLQQRLSWFWMNHFNVFRAGFVGAMTADYAQRVIAPRALGHFRDLLRATMFSPQMLLYLNNAQNARGHINENYAREVMELHTLGVGAGYTQADVTRLAHVLTGLGVDLPDRPVRVRPALRGLVWRDGLVVFNPARHDPDPQVVLDHTLQGRGVQEIEQVVALLADDPATARHVCFELAQYFVADHPDPAMLAAMVRTWQRSDGDIASVLRTMFTSPQFIASLGQPQFKDPMRYVLSALRASVGDRVIRNPRPILGMLARLGEPLDGRSTPDGYPVDGGSWDSPGQLTTRFQIARQLGAGAPALFGPPPPELGGADMAASPRPARRGAVPELAASAVFRAAEPSLRPATAAALAQVGRRVRWNSLWLASPDFMND